jgi:hypothetical protein
MLHAAATSEQAVDVLGDGQDLFLLEAPANDLYVYWHAVVELRVV